jgi:hypothetical protein
VSDIKIGILGVSGAGQMCYLIAMYATMRKGVHDFSLKSREIYDDAYLADKWEEMIYGKDEERWPPCTDFAFKYYYEIVLFIRLLAEVREQGTGNREQKEELRLKASKTLYF